MKYTIFQHTLESNIPLPELQKTSESSPTIFFQSRDLSNLFTPPIDWFHHWRLPSGQISISVGKEDDKYWIRFPKLADFQLDPSINYIIGFRHKNIPDNTIRHLLLDQVIPRMLTHLCRQIIHASCVKVGDHAIAFSGESGWGKSTLAAFFHSKSYTLLTDDCLLLNAEDSTIFGIPNYQGVRLFQDNLEFLFNSKNGTPVAHYGKKNRFVISDNNSKAQYRIAAIFILENPATLKPDDSISITKISGVSATIEMIKHSFPLDITDKHSMGTQLQNLAQIVGSDKMSIYSLRYPRKECMLPEVMTTILKTVK